MQKPSPQFVSRLESELRMAYRAQYQNAAAPKLLRNMWKFFVPAFSGALVLGLVLVNFKPAIQETNTKMTAFTQTINEGPANEERFVTFNEGEQEEEIVNDFDSDELNQIDNSIKLVAAGNY
jgi:hypothetical protein